MLHLVDFLVGNDASDDKESFFCMESLTVEEGESIPTVGKLDLNASMVDFYLLMAVPLFPVKLSLLANP